MAQKELCLRNIGRPVATLLAEKQKLLSMMKEGGYDLSKFELVAVPEAFSDASGTDQISHGGLLEYDGIIDVESYFNADSSSSSEIDPAEGFPTEDFNVTIEDVDSLGHGSNDDIQLLDVPQNDHALHHFNDILDIGIEANDLNSLLEQFEESEQPKVEEPIAEQPKPKQPVSPQKVPVQQVQEKQQQQQQAGPNRVKAVVPQKQHPNPADVIKKIAPVKRKAAILLDSGALPSKKTKVKAVPQTVDLNKAITLAKTTPVSSPIPFNLKSLIPTPKYLSMEHDYCLSPAHSDKSSASDLGTHMSKEQRRAYYKNKYKVKKKPNGIDSPAKFSSASSSPASMSPAGGSPNPSDEASDGRVPVADVPALPPVLPLFDKIPNYFPQKLLVGMYREINAADQAQTIDQGFDKSIFRKDGNDSEGKENYNERRESHDKRRGRSRHKRTRRQSYRKRHQSRKNSLSSQSESSYCSSCSEQSDRSQERDQGYHDRHSHVPRRRRTRSGISIAASRSPSRSRSRSLSRSSYSSYDSHRHSQARHGSYSRSRSRSYSRSRSRSYSRSRSRSYSRSISRSRSQSRSYSRSRSRSRSPSGDYQRLSRSRSRSRSRSFSRSPRRSRRSSYRSPSRSKGRYRSRSQHRNSRSRGSEIRTFDPNADDKEVKYTDEQLQEFSERRVVYVGNIEPETTRRDLIQRFSKFGHVDKVTLHFRDCQDSYGFVTFRYRCDAVASISAGNDPDGPQYDVCFGGRRKFCKTKYEDLDSLNRASADLQYGYKGDGDESGPMAEETEFDKLLKAAMKKR